ncbi:protein of unknown function [Azospirillum lipoferum 4B]|uniref:Uncharacterized protein n=1 Tax=Azospirillum lipoferum (strain 4B) TaxID=862719 RepID=G7Z891_AZOL4|nr:protein of unknown function [Azospirillum lipoferum 4B]
MRGIPAARLVAIQICAPSPQPLSREGRRARPNLRSSNPIARPTPALPLAAPSPRRAIQGQLRKRPRRRCFLARTACR